MTDTDIDKHFDAAKEIAKILNPRTASSKRRVLAYFLDLVNEKGDMQEEYETLKDVAKILGIDP